MRASVYTAVKVVDRLAVLALQRPVHPRDCHRVHQLGDLNRQRDAVRDTQSLVRAEQPFQDARPPLGVRD